MAYGKMSYGSKGKSYSSGSSYGGKKMKSYSSKSSYGSDYSHEGAYYKYSDDWFFNPAMTRGSKM